MKEPNQNTTASPIYLPSEKVIHAITWLYEVGTPGRWAIKLIAKAAAISTGVVTDYFVLARFVAAFVLLFAPWSIFKIAISALLIYDILVAHAAHLLDEDVGSAGPRARVSTGRSLLIALFNVIVLGVLFATLYQVSENCSVRHALAISWSTLTTQGLIQPKPETLPCFVALTQGTTTLFMMAVVLSTVLSGFQPRNETRRPNAGCVADTSK